MCFGIRRATRVATVPCMFVRLIGHFQIGRLESLCELPAVDWQFLTWGQFLTQTKIANGPTCVLLLQQAAFGEESCLLPSLAKWSVVTASTRL